MCQDPALGDFNGKLTDEDLDDIRSAREAMEEPGPRISLQELLKELEVDSGEISGP